MVNCKNCINWRDESLDEIGTGPDSQPPVFMGCRIFGFRENYSHMEDCKHYVASENPFTLCHTCKITVPKVCVSLGECVNCTDTDLYCVDHCIGEENRKFCTHFIRLHSEGLHLIDRDQVFDLFPSIGMPEKPKN